MDYKVFEKYVKPEIQVVELSAEKFLGTSDYEDSEIIEDLPPKENSGGGLGWFLN